MAKTDFDSLLDRLYEDRILRMAAGNRILFDLMPKSPPKPWYTRIYIKLSWLAYAPHRWIHRNCDRC